MIRVGLGRHESDMRVGTGVVSRIIRTAKRDLLGWPDLCDVSPTEAAERSRIVHICNVFRVSRGWWISYVARNPQTETPSRETTSRESCNVT